MHLSDGWIEVCVCYPHTHLYSIFPTQAHLLVGLALQGGHLAEDERLGLLGQRLLHVRLYLLCVGGVGVLRLSVGLQVGRWVGRCARLLPSIDRDGNHQESKQQPPRAHTHNATHTTNATRAYLEAAEHEGPQDLVQLRDEPLLLLGVVDLQLGQLEADGWDGRRDYDDPLSIIHPYYTAAQHNTDLEIEPLVELLRGAEHLGEEEVEERPQLVQAVFVCRVGGGRFR